MRSKESDRKMCFAYSDEQEKHFNENKNETKKNLINKIEIFKAKNAAR
jgi:hypothetical protein